MTRRSLGIGAAVAVIGAGVFASQWFNLTASANGEGRLTVAAAHAGARDGSVLLIDIRTPDEWARTGVGEGAHPLDMRRRDFTTALLEIAQGDASRPVALICARGGRSAALAIRLRRAGFNNVLDVPEGMMGSGAGPGWLRAGLPVVAVKGS